MIIVEYKLNVKDDGSTFHPGWVYDPAYFYDNVSKTFIGVVLDSNDRDYYVPDTVVELTLDQLKDRVKAYPRIEDTAGHIKSDEDIENEIDEWWSKYL